MEGIGRNLMKVIILEFDWRDRGKSRKALVGIAGLLIHI
jgi:hypothetical protein